MSDFESKLREENKSNMELFSYNGGEAQLKHIKDLFTNYIKNSKMIQNISLIYSIFTQDVDQITTIFLKNFANVFILVFQNKSIKFEKTSSPHLFSNSSYFQKNFQ